MDLDPTIMDPVDPAMRATVGGTKGGDINKLRPRRRISKPQASDLDPFASNDVIRLLVKAIVSNRNSRGDCCQSGGHHCWQFGGLRCYDDCARRQLVLVTRHTDQYNEDEVKKMVLDSLDQIKQKVDTPPHVKFRTIPDVVNLWLGSVEPIDSVTQMDRLKQVIMFFTEALRSVEASSHLKPTNRGYLMQNLLFGPARRFVASPTHECTLCHMCCTY